MDAAEDEDNLFAAGDAKLHGGMCNELSVVLEKVLAIFPGVEAARPRSKSGIQALCSLHVALDKARNLLLHCSECSKLYLAITGESILMKFEKTRCDLQESLRSIGCIVPQAISSQVKEIVDDLEGTAFTLDESEKKIGDEVIQLLQDRKRESNSNDNNELEVFHQAVSKLGITSSRAALTERRALKKLIEKARIEDDKRKESIVAFLLHLMRKYSKFFSSDAADDSDSGSAPCSPTISSSVDVSASGRNGRNFARHLSKLGSFSFLKNRMRSGDVPLPPEEFRCPISLQLMYDPVIISSGQTFERVCIEKWINDGHSTCPKTQEKLSHLVLTPNYCVKSLITSWCEHNGVPIPEGPPESLDLNYWRLALSETEAKYSSSMGSTDSCKLISGAVAHLEDISAVEELNSNEADMSLGSIDSSTPLEDSSAVEELKGKREDTSLGSIDSCKLDSVEVAPLEESGYGEVKSTEAGTSDNSSFQDSKEVQSDRYDRFLALLNDSKSAEEKQKTIQEIRCLLKDNEEARIYMGENGFVEALVQFLRSAIDEGDQKAQEIGSMALFNLAVNNNSNKGRILSSGVMQLLEKMALNSETWEPATALYLSLSCLDDAKPVIGSSEAVPFLIKLLRDSDPKRISCKGDALYALYNLSTHRPNIPSLLSRGIIGGLRSALQAPTAHASLAVLINMAATTEGRKQIMSAAGFMGALTAVLDAGEPPEQEQAVTCLLLLCNEDEKCSHVVLQEGVIPGLVCVSAYGTPKGKERAQRLLKLFREQRQQESEVLAARLEPQQQAESIVSCGVEEEPEVLPLRKSASLRFAKSLSHIWKSRKSYSVRRSS